MLRKVGWQRRNASRGPPPDYVFFFGRSARSSRNSPGPFRSRRFLCCCSSAVADGSASLSICWPARSMAFDVAFGLRRFMSCDPASPSSTSRRMASERSGFRFASLPKRPHFHAIRTKAGLPSLGLAQWPACLSFFALRFCVTPSYFLYYPRRQQRLARKIGDGPAEWEFTVSPGELPRPRRPRRSRRRGASHLGGL